MRIWCILVSLWLVFSPLLCSAQESGSPQAVDPSEYPRDTLREELDPRVEDVEHVDEWIVPDGFDDEDPDYPEDGTEEVQPVVGINYEHAIELSSLDNAEISLPDPFYTIEEIRITGNSMTSEARIRSILQIAEGQEIQLSILESAKARLSALGSFESAEVRLLPGSDKGNICIEVRVSERMHIQFNDYYIGLSEKSDFWLGLNTSFLNPLGSGHRFNLSFVATPKSEYAFNLNYIIPNIAGSSFFISLGMHSAMVQEEVFVRSKYIEQVSSEYLAPERLGINRHGVTLLGGFRPLSVLSLTLGIQLNTLHRFDDKVMEEKRTTLDEYLLPGKSISTGGFASIMFDTRRSPRMPDQGHLVGLNIGGTFRSAVSDYKYFRAFLFHESNFTLVPEHILRVMSSAGAVIGDAPYYDKFQYADFYPLNPGRISTFKPSSAGAFDIFKTGASDLGYEDFIVNVGIEYAWQRMLMKANIRRLEIYCRLNAVYADSLDVPTLALGNDPDGATRGRFPIDGGLDFGVRLETEFGFFKFSLGYVLNMVPR